MSQCPHPLSQMIRGVTQKSKRIRSLMQSRNRRPSHYVYSFFKTNCKFYEMSCMQQSKLSRMQLRNRRPSHSVCSSFKLNCTISAMSCGSLYWLSVSDCTTVQTPFDFGSVKLFEIVASSRNELCLYKVTPDPRWLVKNLNPATKAAAVPDEKADAQMICRENAPPSQIYLTQRHRLGQGGQGALQRARSFLCDALRAGVLIFV